MSKDEQLKHLSSLFGSYKAEWLQDSLFELYSEPSYVPELTTTRPCVLSGGRGTGKTTVLRSLSYIGQWEIAKRSNANISDEELARITKNAGYYGFYYRANTPRISAFQGSNLSIEEWQKIFLHYINFLFSLQLIKFLQWYQLNADTQFKLGDSVLSNICGLLALDSCTSVEELISQINRGMVEIESYINNIGIDQRPRISPTGSLDGIFSLISSLPNFKGKTFFLIIDEYENFLDEQQQVFNTLIKHTNASYTFKIGVRKLGWRVRYTLNKNEVLTSPADYVLIDIAEKIGEQEFNKFAEQVCNSRIAKLFESNPNAKCKTVKEMFPSLSLDREAELLGISEITEELRYWIAKQDDEKLSKLSSSLKNLDLYVIKYIADGTGIYFLDALREAMEDSKWNYRLEEYAYAALFTIRSKRSGIRKYYAGWDVFSKLSAINIRYLLELVEQTLLLHLKENHQLGEPVLPELQTYAAQAVGKKNLQELGGSSTYGAKLTKLVLGLGRVFGLLAENSGGHAIEVNQFRIKATKSKEEPGTEEWLASAETAASKIISAAVMHLAIIPFPGNKPKSEGETRESTFQLHPIFAPYFICSFRKRRNLVLDEQEILGLIDYPKETIKNIMKANNREMTSDLPEQLQLFSSYYN